MEAALHDPEFGYYARNIGTVGRSGDFSTSATLSGIHARALASWVREQRALLSSSVPASDSEGHPPQRPAGAGQGGGVCHLIEIGPGTGQLHRDLRRALGWRGRRGLRSHLVERSPKLRAVQRRTLGFSAAWGRVGWHDHPAAALKAAGGRALIFSNELVDAFPVTLLQRDGGTWQEVWLELLPDGRLVESLRPAAEPPRTSLKPEAFAEGQRIEVHESYRQWLAEWLPAWKAGSMLTIDYGDNAETLYYRRPQGSLRGYRRHARREGLGIYQDPGQCDLTADVNFTDLRQWGAAAGLTSELQETQSQFLLRHATARNKADEYLTDSAGAGGAFVCLHQRPEAETERHAD
jgi:SAM-dependent MidA family methyltransferase